MLVCPITHCELQSTSLQSAEERLGGVLATAPRHDTDSTPIGSTDFVLVRADGGGAYPVLPGGIPVLLAPELLVVGACEESFDLSSPIYAEAYAEMGHYEELTAAVSGHGVYTQWLDTLLAAGDPDELVESFPHAWSRWLDAPYDSLAQWDCYRAIGRVKGRRVAQIGGSGLHAVKLLLAGAQEAFLFSPIVGELLYARALAEHAGVADRLTVVAALGEQLPVADASLDAIYSGGSLHHMQTDLSAPELHRVLVPGGAFTSAEPWRSPLYALGVSVFGKRETGAQCTPLTPDRVAPLRDAFSHVDVVHHGALTRYLTLALAKVGLRMPLRHLKRIYDFDDMLSNVVPRLRRQGSSVSVIARRAAA